jgi:type IV pilus assembly protein PilY1
MIESISRLTRIAGFVLGGFAALPLQAEMAQDPLLSRTAAVEPNIVFMFDDSGSMPGTSIYQFGGVASGMGMTGPNNDPTICGFSICSVWMNLPTTFHGRSPDVNLIYYDPRVTYKRRVNADGTEQAAGSTTGIGSFNVYFYKPPASTTYGVSGVSVINKGSGYPATGVTAAFPMPPAGGTQATATVQVASTLRVSSVTVNKPGAGYPNTGIVATFSDPPPGGVRATGNVTTSNFANAVSTVTVTNRGRDYAATGVVATFTNPPAGGTPATGNVIISATKKVGSVAVASMGSGFSGAPTVTFSAPPSPGVRATGTVNLGTAGSITGVGVISGGCFPNNTTVSFSDPQAANGVRATADVVRANNGLGCSGGNRRIVAINMTNVGSGYSSLPTLTFSPAGSGLRSFLPVLGLTNVISSITITDPGIGYTSAPTVTIGNAGGGTGATLNAVLADTNWITGFTITHPGSGYTSNPSISLSNTGGGTGALFSTSRATVRGISGITVINGGSGYTSAPTITISASSGSGADFTAVTGTTYVISGITITNSGSGYATQPTFTLSGTSGGSGATFSYNYTPVVTAGVNKTWDGVGTPTTSVSYFTPTYTPDSGSPLAVGASLISYPNTATSSVASYPKFRNRTDCGTASSTVCTWAQELQNYANWKTYHSTRMELAKTGIGLAFQPLNPTFRLGWGTINKLDDDSELHKGVRLYDSTVQGEFLTWLYARAVGGGTPNRVALDKVGQYFQRSDNSGPWADSPSGNSTSVTSGAAESTAHASCRRSYAMLMTDGYYNDSLSLTDEDTSAPPAITTPTSYQYSPVGPYSDTVDGTKINNTFADVAMKYWVRDLRPNLPNAVKPVPGDEAYWQHLNFYAIGLGLVGTLNANDPQVLADLTGSASSSPPRTKNWPSPTNENPTSIDDMWHATINGRGKMLNAKTAAELNSAIVQMMSDISGKEATQSGVAVSTASLTQGTKKYTPSYTSVSWNGNVTAYNLDPNTGNQLGIAWQVETLLSTDPVSGKKTYSSLIPSHASRNIYVGNGATSGTRAVEFKHATMGAGLLGQMNGTVNADLINFLRGDDSKEHSSVTESDPTAIYRPRSTRLGDIVNSTPVFVKDTLDLSYEKLPAGTDGRDSYRAFVDGSGAPATGGKKQRPEGVLFVGANDGMLHAFRDGAVDSNGVVTSQGGVEIFAYVPNALLGSLHRLADETYAHRYYVDGPNVETDAFFGGGWQNLVLGTTGAGAGALSSSGVSPRSAVYAINTTSLNSGPTTLNASNVLWEVSSNQSDFSQLGYVLTDVQAGASKNSTHPWIAIFGNGYESKSCKAMLYVVNLQTGARIKEIDTGAGNCSTAVNGLGGVRLVRNANQQIIGAYAGDLLGNVWKFNFNDTDITQWDVDLGKLPLLKAGASQPLTAPPAVLKLPLATGPATAPKTGYMVMVGTGKFFEVPDITTTTQQSFYSIWDPLEFGTATIAAGTRLDMSVAADKTKLVQQTIGASVTSNGNTYAAVSSNPVEYTDTLTVRGCFLNFVGSGQRMVYPIDVLANRLAIVDTISPANVSLDPCVNENGGSAFVYILDALTCGATTNPLLDTNGDGNVDGSDLLVSGFESPADGRNVTLEVGETGRFVNCSGGSPGCTQIAPNCADLGTCVTPAPASGFKSREWRQLFMR